MGMIMKDGIPYGGIYPIDDALDANSAHVIQNKPVAENVLAIENVLGAKNVFPGWSVESATRLMAEHAVAQATAYVVTFDAPGKSLQYRLYYHFSDGTSTEVTSAWTSFTNNTSFTTTSNTVKVGYRLKISDDSAISVSDIVNTMVRPVGTDSTYVPYAKTNKELTEITDAVPAMENILGAKNLLPNRSVDGMENGLTFTTNADGSITVNGTATATTNHIIYYTEYTPDWLLNKDLIFSGCTGGASQGKYRLWMGDKTWDGIVECTDGDRLFNISQNKGMLCIIQVVGNVTMNNVTFYPMIRPAGTDSTYVKYTMNNAELMEKKSEVIDFGEITGGIGAAWDLLTVYDKPVMCCWGEGGKNLALLYKYSGGNYGMGFCQIYYSNSIVTLSVSGGVKTTRTINPI